MKQDFLTDNWKAYIPEPICEDAPEYDVLYQKAWELARDHVRSIDGMPQSPYMDEAFCDTQIWIWDTCFMSLFCKYAQEVFPGKESLRNFYDVLYGNVELPFVIPPENEPHWTLATPGVPIRIKIHIADNPPLFAFAELENALFHGDVAYLRDLLYNRQALQKHYDWVESLKTRDKLPGVRSRTYLIKEDVGYLWEGGRSGMDNTPRGRTTERADMERPNNPDMLWIDAICQQALTAQGISKLFELVGDEENRELWQQRYQEKKELVNRFYWDAQDGIYYDIDRNDHHFYKVITPASYWALVAGIADEKQAKAMTAYIEDEKILGGDVPLLSLSRSDSNFESHGQYWRGSLWMPTAYATLKGLDRYGYYELAHQSGRKILDHMLRTYLEFEPHTIWECYSPEKPMPATIAESMDLVRKDFCGWSALGPISVYIEDVIGLHTVDAFRRLVQWQKPAEFRKKLGVKNFRFGDVVTDIVAEGDSCFVKSNQPYTLEINGKAFQIEAGEQTISL